MFDVKTKQLEFLFCFVSKSNTTRKTYYFALQQKIFA